MLMSLLPPPRFPAGGFSSCGSHPCLGFATHLKTVAVSDLLSIHWTAACRLIHLRSHLCWTAAVLGCQRTAGNRICGATHWDMSLGWWSHCKCRHGFQQLQRDHDARFYQATWKHARVQKWARVMVLNIIKLVLHTAQRNFRLNLLLK